MGERNMSMRVGAVLLLFVAGLWAACAGAAWANTIVTDAVGLTSGYADVGGGVWEYAYQIADEAQFFPSVQIPDPGNLNFGLVPVNPATLNPFFSDVPGVAYNPMAVIESGGVLRFGPTSPYDLTSGGVSTILAFTAPDPPAFEDATVTYLGGTILVAGQFGPEPFQVWGPAPEPPSAVLVGGGLVMMLCALASLKGKRRADVNGSLSA
jgi:hypothetical protein